MEHERQVAPQGAIWVKNFKLRKAIADFISTMDVGCPKCTHHFQPTLSPNQEEDLNETVINHVMTVKIKAMREKYIAIFNPKKCLSTHPDYYLYVYQAFTGAPSVYPFNDKASQGAEGSNGRSEGHSSTHQSSYISSSTHKSAHRNSSATDSSAGEDHKHG